MPEDLSVIAKKLDDAMGALAANREANDAELKKHDVLNEEKHQKTAEVISKVMEELQAAKTRADALEATLKRADKTQEQNEPTEHQKQFDAFARTRCTEKKEIEILTKTMSRGSNPDGGYLVMPQMGGILEARIFETSPIRQLANVISISQEAFEEFIDDDEAATGGWVNEQSTRNATDNPQIRKKRIPVYEQFAMPQATQQFLDDAAVNIESWLATKVADILSRTENTSFVIGVASGDGQTASKPKGFTTYPAWASAGVYEYDKIEQVNSGSAGAVSADGLISLQNSLIEAYQANATFVMRRQTFAPILKLKTGTGEYLFNRALDRNAGRPFDLLGAPVVFAADMPAVASGALAVAYGDFRRAYTIVDRSGISILRDPYTTKGLVKFYTTKRVGGDVVNFEALKLLNLSA